MNFALPPVLLYDGQRGLQVHQDPKKQNIRLLQMNSIINIENMINIINIELI